METVTAAAGMPMEEMGAAFDPAIIASDLSEVRRIYSEFLATSPEEAWDKPAQRGGGWTLHETIAHQCALNGAGLESVKHTLRGEPYTFVGLDDRYRFTAYNRRGIDELLGLSRDRLREQFLGVLDEAADIAHGLGPEQAARSSRMPIYNRAVRVDEVLSIIDFHSGLGHSAQVAEPAGLPPLWTRLSPEAHHRLITRVMLAFSLLYRYDIGGPLRAPFAFRIDGPGGGEWHLDVSPTATAFGEGAVERPTLVLHLRDTSVFCQMLTGRFRLPTGVLTGRMKLRGDLRLFLRMGALLSVDARPKARGGVSIEARVTGGGTS